MGDYPNFWMIKYDSDDSILVYSTTQVMGMLCNKAEGVLRMSDLAGIPVKISFHLQTSDTELIPLSAAQKGMLGVLQKIA